MATGRASDLRVWNNIHQASGIRRECRRGIARIGGRLGKQFNISDLIVINNHRRLGLIIGNRFDHPALDFNYESTIMPMKDGLPKFKNFPSDFGGSAEALPEVSSIHQRWLFALMSALDILMGKRSRMIASASAPK